MRLYCTLFHAKLMCFEGGETCANFRSLRCRKSPPATVIAQWDSKQKLVSRRQTRLTWAYYAVTETENGMDGQTKLPVYSPHRHGKCHSVPTLSLAGTRSPSSRFTRGQTWEGFERPKSDMVYSTRPCPRSYSSAINFK
jgi:hypothetical protein